MRVHRLVLRSEFIAFLAHCLLKAGDDFFVLECDDTVNAVLMPNRATLKRMHMIDAVMAQLYDSSVCILEAPWQIRPLQQKLTMAALM